VGLGGRAGPLPRHCSQCRPPGRARRPPHLDAVRRPSSGVVDGKIHGKPQVKYHVDGFVSCRTLCWLHCQKSHEQPTLDIVFAVDPGTLRFDLSGRGCKDPVTGSWAGPPAGAHHLLGRPGPPLSRSCQIRSHGAFAETLAFLSRPTEANATFPRLCTPRRCWHAPKSIRRCVAEKPATRAWRARTYDCTLKD
jgi:hypothetical protein